MLLLRSHYANKPSSWSKNRLRPRNKIIKTGIVEALMIKNILVSVGSLASYQTFHRPFGMNKAMNTKRKQLEISNV